jgi:LPS-assembly protein
MGQEWCSPPTAAPTPTTATTTTARRPDLPRRPGLQFRAVGALAADVRWPLIGNPFRRHAAHHAARPVRRHPADPQPEHPNEDSRSVDLESGNLFALNRFPGHDRWEDASRITYGLEYALDRPNLSLRTVVGQSYRLKRQPSIFPEGTGLTDRLSDVVGRTELEIGTFVDVTHRLPARQGQSGGAPQRARPDAGDAANLRHHRLPAPRPRHQPRGGGPARSRGVRLGGRVQLGRFWSVFGSAVVDLTDAREDPFSGADGYEPVRHRLGIAYDDDCLEVGITWRRDYERFGDARQGNTFLFRLALKNLGL